MAAAFYLARGETRAATPGYMMQVVEKPVEGLSRSYGVRVPAAELATAVNARITEILPTMNLKGFRPGKVPRTHVQRVYGKTIMGEVIEKTINETSQQVLVDNNLRIAARPELKPVSDMDQVLAGREDLAYDLEVEVMPEFEPCDVGELSLTRLTYRAAQDELDTALAELVSQNKTYAAREDVQAAAQGGDQLLIDFVGRIDGENFEGGAADDAELVLGAGQFIPGFEEQLAGAKVGDAITVNVTFPADYAAARLAGKAAVFDVKVKEVRGPKQAEADDALAVRLGLADMTALQEALRASVERQYEQASRFKLKRALLDALDTRHDIPLPPRMVEAEFEGIWSQVEKDRASGEESPEDAAKSEADLRVEYRHIAERRVRLGLVLAEIGRRNEVSVTEAELGDAMRTEATRYGEQAQQMFDLMRGNADFRAQLQAPLYEEKVVDLIIGKAVVTDKPVSKEVLLKDDDLPEGYGADDAAAVDVATDEPVKPAKKAKAKTKAVDAASPPLDTVAAADVEPARTAPAKPAKPRAPKAAKPTAVSE